MPDGIDPAAIKANLAQGVLTIILPKTPEAQSTQKKIPITASPD